MAMRPPGVTPGTDYEIFAREGETGVGAVRRIHGGRMEAFIENFGEVTLLPEHVAAVHDGKIVLALDALPEDVRRAVERAHEREDPDYVDTGDGDPARVGE